MRYSPGRYHREIEVASGLDHPALQRLLSTPNVPCMVLEHVEGETREGYASMAAALAGDLNNLDAVVLPEKYERDEPPPAPLGDLPPWRSTLPILAIVLGVLAALGFLAQLLHHTVAPANLPGLRT